jgi:dihydrofolate reductase
MAVRAIWAQTPSKVLGDGEDLLWHLPEDMKFFKQTTHNQTVVMGRKTWDSLPERFRPLPNRRNVIVSRTNTAYAGAETVTDLKAFLTETTEDVWIIGGSQIYQAALPYTNELYITQVQLDITEGVYAPEYVDQFSLVNRTPLMISTNGTKYQFEQWARTN